MFATEGQHLIFLAFFGGGLICGLLYDLLYLVRAFCRFKFVTDLIADLLFMAAAGGLLLIIAAKVSYGQIRLYSVISYIFGYFLEYGALHKRFAKLSDKVYNHFTTVAKALAKTKVVKKILK